MFSFSLLSGISFSDVEERSHQILKKYPVKAFPHDILKTLPSFLDLTSLEGSDHSESIKKLCQKALSFKDKSLPLPAAVCIYPPFIHTAKHELQGSGIHVATTAAAFPSGQMSLKVKLEEIKFAMDEGADEIDVVISRGTFLENNYHTVYRELDSIREITRGKTLKVILETGELQSYENIAKASEIAIEAGADFIKTSTGKISPAATEQSVLVMLEVILSHYKKTGIKIGIKPAGGIADIGKAMNYYYLVKEVLGEEWLSHRYFRLGASRLADRILELF